jgi:hypothetical protein
LVICFHPYLATSFAVGLQESPQFRPASLNKLTLALAFHHQGIDIVVPETTLVTSHYLNQGSTWHANGVATLAVKGLPNLVPAFIAAK